jgi:hypothetical protein
MTIYAQRVRDVLQKLDELLSLLDSMTREQVARARSTPSEADELRFLRRDQSLLGDARGAMRKAIDSLDMGNLVHELGSLAGTLAHLESNFSRYTAGPPFKKISGPLSTESLLLTKDLMDAGNLAVLKSELASSP